MKKLTLDDETEADLRAGLSKGTRDNLTDADRAAINRFRPRSPPPRSSSLPSGEGGPSVMLDSGGGETLDTPQASSPEKSGSSEKAAPTKFEFVPNFATGGNYILRKPDFYISYAARTGMGGLTMFAGDGDGSETALVARGKFFILNGDWRSEYEPLAEKGLDACLEFFRQHEAAHNSSWSTKD